VEDVLLGEGSGGDGGGWKGRTVLLAVARDDVLYGLFVLLLAEVCIVLCLGDFLPASNLDIDFLLEGSLISCHLPFPAVREAREVAGVRLWE